MILRINRKYFICYLFLSLSTFISAQQELKAIDKHLDALFGDYNNGLKPGVSVAIMQQNKPIFMKSYGHANLEYGIKNTPNTLFNTADLAKQFTVFSILILEEQGKLTINDDVKKHLPELSEWPFKITLKHLMEQTSGLRDVMELKKWIGYKNGDVITRQDIIDIAAKQKHLNFPSGNKFEYNRTGFVLLTEVIAKVSGMSFPDFVDQYIFTPLKMHNSMFVDSTTELIKNRAYSYTVDKTKFINIPSNSSFVGGTNLYTSVADFTKWLQNMPDQSIGKPAFYNYMHTKIKLLNGQNSNYTPGIFKDESQGYSRIHLEGFDHGYTAYMLHIPEHDFSLVYFSNDGNFPHEDVNKKFENWFNTDYSIDPVKPFVLPNVKLVNKSKKELQAYTGNFLFEDTYSIRKIVLENDTLFYVRSKTNRTPIIPIEGNHTFKMLYPNEDNLRVTFKNQGKFLEFRAINNPKDYPDYVSLGRNIKLMNVKQDAFSNTYKNEALGHTISLQSANGEMRLTLNDVSVLLNQIGVNEFLAEENSKVSHVKLERDVKGNFTGIYLSGGQINNLYYRVIEN